MFFAKIFKRGDEVKKNEKRILLIEIIALLFLILNIFVKNILTEYTIILFLLILFILSVILVGFEKEKTIEKRKVLKQVFFYTISFLIIVYGLGLIVGFLSTSYSLTLINIFKNSFPVFLILIIEELVRYNICKKGENNKLIIYISVVIFTFVDISMIISNYDLNDISNILKLSTLVVCPSVFKNVMLSDFSKKYGYEVCITYQLIMGLYIYIVPIFPNLNEYLESVIMSILPIFILILINMQFEIEKKEDIRDKHIASKILSVIIILIVIITICLFSNLFPWWIAIVGSGSMTPTINVGDAIIVDKITKEEMAELKVGDILVFKVGKSMYTHRIINIDVKNDEYYISTKGDRKGNVVDDWTVKSNDVIGVVKFRIPYVGYPTVQLNRLLKGGSK